MKRQRLSIINDVLLLRLRQIYVLIRILSDPDAISVFEVESWYHRLVPIFEG